MSDTTPKPADDTKLRPRISPTFIMQVLGGMPYLGCVVELIKNSIDWFRVSNGETRIWITTKDPARFMIRDNGRGMDRKRREASLQLGDRPTDPELALSQSGNFCSGLKRFHFSQALQMTIVTAPQEEPDCVYRYTLTVLEHATILASAGERDVPPVAKSRKTWPYDHPFGTVITFELKEPKRRTIHRGEALARQLADILPQRTGKRITIDDATKLPPPNAVGGRIFEVDEAVPSLGSLAMELYRSPSSSKSGGKGIRLTGREVGEATLERFLDAIGPDLAKLIPEIYLFPGLQGTLSVPFIFDVVNEDRTSFSEGAAEHPHTTVLLEQLQRFAPEVERALNIRIGSGESLDASDPFSGVWDQVRETYGTGDGEELVETPGGDDDLVCVGPTESGERAERRPIRLECGMEYGLGEVINVEARLRADLGRPVSDLDFDTAGSRARNPQRIATGLQLEASEVGTGEVAASLRGTGHQARVRYRIVPRREFRLSAVSPRLTVDDMIIVTAINTDLLRDPTITWELTGVGLLKPEGGRVRYHATVAGEAVIIATGIGRDGRPVRAICRIAVNPKRERPLIIRDQRFRVMTASAGPGMIFMVRRDRVHDLYYSPASRAELDALAPDAARMRVLMALSAEFVRFVSVELNAAHTAATTPSDIAAAIADAACESPKVLQELLQRKRA